MNKVAILRRTLAVVGLSMVMDPASGCHSTYLVWSASPAWDCMCTGWGSASGWQSCEPYRQTLEEFNNNIMPQCQVSGICSWQPGC